jgi:uncharacterized repeat protein (TIGR01451 family)
MIVVGPMLSVAHADSAPTANVTIDGVGGQGQIVTANVGDSVNFAWSSTNATTGSGDLQISDPSGNSVPVDPCGNTSGNFPLIQGTSGTVQGTALACQVGYTYRVILSGENSQGETNVAAVFFYVADPTPPAPDARFYVNDVKDVTVPIGTPVNFSWGSSNATSGSSSLVIYNVSGVSVPVDPCGNTAGNFPLVQGLNGSVQGTALACQLGYRYVITFGAANAQGVTATSSVSVTVQNPTISSFTANGGAEIYVSPGPDPVTYQWTSENGTSFHWTQHDENGVASPTCESSTSSNCDVASGTIDSGPIANSAIGHTYTVTFSATAASTTVSKSVIVHVVGATSPTASFTANGAKTITVPVGAPVAFAWSSTNTTVASATIAVFDHTGAAVSVDACGGNVNGPWSFITTPNGSITSSTLPCQLGYTYVITFGAANAQGVTATSSVSVTVQNPVIIGGGGGGGSSAGISPSTGTFTVSVGGLQNGATSTVVLRDTTANITVATTTGNGSPSFTLPINDNYVVNVTTTAANYSLATSTGCAGTFSGSQTCTVAFTFSASTSTPTSTVSSGDISLSKIIDNATPNEGDTVNYTITARALGPATSTGVVAHDILPPGLLFLSATSTLGSYSATTGNWTIGDMAASSTATLKITAMVNAGTAGTSITNTATISESALSTDPNPGNNTGTATINVLAVGGGGGASSSTADLAVTKTVDNASPTNGATVNYTITARALGPATSTGVFVTDLLPSGLTFVNATATQGTYVTSTGLWMIGTLSASSSATLTIATVINASAGTAITNTATGGESSTLVDPSTNDAASATIAVPGGIVQVSGGGGSPSGGGGGSGGGLYYSYDLNINNGASQTTSTIVTLQPTGTGATQMWFSNDPGFSMGGWVPLQNNYSWTLSSGSGNKTVYVRYGNNGSIIGAAQASIQLIGSAASDNGAVLGVSTSTGQVLGASISCGIYMNSYIKRGAPNDPNEVRKLQAFLNKNLGANLPITGFYGSLTEHAVNQFQLKYKSIVLTPWIGHGLINDSMPTGYVYKTTLRWINELSCPPLNIPLPDLS